MPGTAVTQAAPYRLRCLGPVSLTAPDGAARKFRTRKQMGLLVLLAQKAGRPYGREQLVELLWGADEPAAARHSLAQSISIINKAFGHDAIRVAGKDQVELREGMVWLDAEEFERAVRDGRYEEARSLWRGPLLEGLWVQRAAGFDAWIDSERQRLTRMYRDVLHHEMERERAAGRWPAMRATAEALLADDQLDEAAMLGFLESLALGGDRTLALRSFGDFEKRLMDELGAEPGAALKAWIRRQRKGEDAPAPPPMPLPRMTETQVLPAARPVYGREEEFKFLWNAWGAAQQNSGAFIIMEGQAGIGKSALATKLANQVHVMGGAVCFVRCWRTEKSVPFAPITALIRQLMRLPGFVALNEVWIGELSRLVPELRERYPAAPAPMAIDDSARHRICDGTLQAAACVADEQPLMIIVDDIHNADEATLALLHYFGRQTRDKPTLLLCTARLDAAETELERNFFETARTARLARFLKLGSLPIEDTARIARDVFALRGLSVPDWAVVQVCADSAGIPLQTVEIAMGIPDPTNRGASPSLAVDNARSTGRTSTFEQSSVERLAQLPHEAQVVAGVLATAGRPLSDFELSLLVNLPIIERASAIYALEAANFVRRTGGSVYFVHERYLAAAQSAPLPVEQASIHERLADLLARTAELNPAALYESATHYEKAGLLDKAHSHALEAAKYAASIGAVREQARALALGDRTGTIGWRDLAQLGHCLISLEDIDGATQLCSRAARGVDYRNDAEARAEFDFLNACAVLYSSGGSWSGLLMTLKSILERGVDFPAKRRAQFLLLRAADRSGNVGLAKRFAKRTRRELLACGGRGDRATAWAITSFLRTKYYRVASAIPFMLEAIRLAKDDKIWEVQLWTLQGLGAVYLRTGQYEESIRYINSVIALSRSMLDPSYEAIALNDRAVSEMALGRFSEAEASLKGSFELSRHLRDWPSRGYPVTNMGVLCFFTGRLDEAARHFEEGFRIASELGIWTHQLMSSGGRALCAVRIGDLDTFRVWVAKVEETIGQRDTSHLQELYLLEAALAWSEYLLKGNAEEAVRRLTVASHRLRKRDIEDWLRLQLECVLIAEHKQGRRDEDARARIRNLATEYSALGIAADAS